MSAIPHSLASRRKVFVIIVVILLLALVLLQISPTFQAQLIGIGSSLNITHVPHRLVSSDDRKRMRLPWSSNCTNMEFCKLRYKPIDPTPLPLSLKKKQWSDVSTKYGLQIVHQNPLARKASFAWVTMISTPVPDLIGGSLVMMKALRDHDTKYPIVLLITDNAAPFFSDKTWKDAVMKYADMIVRVPTMRGYSRAANYWEKLYALSLVQFDRIGWLGGDTLSIANIDEMMLCHPPCGAYDQHLWKMTSIGAIINGDVVVLRPTITDFENLMTIAKPYNAGNSYKHEYFNAPSNVWQGPFDQGAMNTYYGRYMTVLPAIYHLELRGSGGESGYFSTETKNLHFASRFKPWKMRTVYAVRYWCPVAAKVWAESNFPMEIYPLSCRESQ